MANSTETTPIDFTNPLERIYNYTELGNVCSVTYTSFKLYEGIVKKGFLIVTPLHTALFAFGKNEENMECYDLTWTKYERSYRSIDESLDANEFRREITLQGSSDLYNKISSVSVSSTGTATDTISYITVDGVEKKIGGGTKLYHIRVNFGTSGSTYASFISSDISLTINDYFSEWIKQQRFSIVACTGYNQAGGYASTSDVYTLWYSNGFYDTDCKIAYLSGSDGSKQNLILDMKPSSIKINEL